ncbi:transglutaminase-like domain-containing protein [Desulfosudis oleivorans]|uniref:Transglutaminase domain protein n=1 Tax=Desulfosudis oleivorans (strain DSM 6200 / JCM 39069 / Hxd3) TaxID=96561 RepID=A8ZSP5_DESOH|nr:transglutaminase family protein [Desulfosudis oleivorans]ABW65958.1 transglutaminase domain protein [Desulfosudis oleivorans Hxd3]
MPKKTMKPYWMAGLLMAGLFAVLLGMRFGLFSGLMNPSLPGAAHLADQVLPEQDTWMSILQNDKKIGYSHSRLFKTADGYAVAETVFLNITAMGMRHAVKLNTSAVLHPDLTVDTFSFKMDSGRLSFSAQGRVADGRAVVNTTADGKTQSFEIPLQEAPYLPSGVLHAVTNSSMAPGESMTFSMFDPSIMATTPVTVTVVGKETITVLGVDRITTKIHMRMKQAEQFAWLSEDGEVVKESGLMGLTLVKAEKYDAIAGLSEDAADLVELVAVDAGVRFDNPSALKWLAVEISGIDINPDRLSSVRQSFDEQVLTITKESLYGRGDRVPAGRLAPFLLADPFVQSDDPAIRELAARITKDHSEPVKKAQALIDWVYTEIEKRPVVSLPNALSTLRTRQGDCNEHAVLLAALARAAGIPAGIETGLVYLDGKFFYHAWNSLYVGKWITADATFGQFPADVTHIRLAGGTGEGLLDLMGIIGKIQLKVVAFEPAGSQQ